MKRAEVEADQMPGQDSFLDVITNIVGILILLVLVVGLRTSHSVREAPDVQLATKARGEAEYKEAYTNAVSTERDVRSLVARVGNALEETDFREQEREWLNTNLVAAEQEIDERRSRLSTDEQRDFDVRQKLATAQATLDDLTRQQVALMSREPVVQELECQPTPLATTVTGKEVHVLLSEDHLAIVPFDEMLEQMKLDAQNNVWRMREKSAMERTIGPVNGFRLKYRFIREDISAPGSGGYVNGSVSRFSHCYLLPVTTPAGEPAQEAMQPKSEFYQQLQRNRPEGTTITIWTYPGNFERLREIKRTLREMGYAIAVRPLPPGMPIGASSSGSKSLAE
ncbi:MAG: hypothetical protein U0805_12180 [Pirellulales bacterium]